MDFFRHLPSHLARQVVHDCFEDLFERSEFRRSNQPLNDAGELSEDGA